MNASCPSCGGAIAFRHGASLLVVCGYCGSAVARKGASVEGYGKVAELLPTSSRLRLGMTGAAGSRTYRLVGRVQLDHGQGTWDEWHVAFDDGGSAWLAEAQGRFHLMSAAALPPLPRYGDLSVGATLDLGPEGSFVVAEVKHARFARAEGELPFDAAPGSDLRYADLSGPKGRFATLDYGAGDDAEALWVGSERDLKALGIAVSDLTPLDEGHAPAEGQSLSCTQCAGPLEVRAPDATQRIACPWCGSLLDVGERYKVIEIATSVGFKPALALGARGKLPQGEFTVIGAMERSVTVEGTRYPWREYLLLDEAKGFRWLTESNGHWSFVEPLPPGDFAGQASRAALAAPKIQHGGETYKHFQSGTARVDHVLGEFYWAVARGETTETHDYVAAPSMISIERSDAELHFSRGTYVAPEVVWRGFAQKGKPPQARGVAANEPWPHGKKMSEIGSLGAKLAAVLVLLFIVWRIAGTRTVLRQSFPVPDVPMGGEAPETAVFTQEFQVHTRGNLAVEVRAPVSNNWMYFEGAAINETTGEFFPFDVEVSYYFGRDSDGSWSEGGTAKTRFIGSIAPGRYLVRLAPRWQGARPADRFDVVIRSSVPRFGHLVLALLAIGFTPLLLGWSYFSFERRRWAESDHPWGESQ